MTRSPRKAKTTFPHPPGRIIRSAEHPKLDWGWIKVPDGAESEFMGTFPEAVTGGVKV
jgi:hypothetical protein